MLFMCINCIIYTYLIHEWKYHGKIFEPLSLHRRQREDAIE